MAEKPNQPDPPGRDDPWRPDNPGPPPGRPPQPPPGRIRLDRRTHRVPRSHVTSGMRPWWIRLPERLDHEKQALDVIGATYVLDENARARGILRLDVQFGEHRLVAEYPDLYPFFRPQVFAPDLNLTHHQNPVDKNLCLLGRATENWRPRIIDWD